LFESTREQSLGPHLHLSDPASLRYYPSALLSNPKVLNSHTLFPALSPAPYESFDPHHSTSTSPPAQPTVAFECEAIVISPRFDNGLRIVWATQASIQLNLPHEQKAVRFSFPSHTLVNLAARRLEDYDFIRLLRLFEVGFLKRFLALVSYWGIHSTCILPYSGLTKCFRYHVCFHFEVLVFWTC
jgi:hypothetical protein